MPKISLEFERVGDAFRVVVFEIDDHGLRCVQDIMECSDEKWLFKLVAWRVTEGAYVCCSSKVVGSEEIANNSYGILPTPTPGLQATRPETILRQTVYRLRAIDEEDARRANIPELTPGC